MMNHHAPTILIVDDTPEGRETLEALLEPLDYHLVSVSNGYEALHQAENNPPDLMLLDVMMPGFSGYETCREARANPLLSELPIIMVTSLDDRDSRLLGLQSGADDFITKPLNGLELRARVKTVIRLNRYRRLLAERERFGWAIDQATDGFLVINRRDEITYANAVARKYLNLSLHEPIPEGTSFLVAARQQFQLEPPEAWGRLKPGETAQTRYLVHPETPSANAFWLHIEHFDMPADAGGDQLVRLHDVTQQMAGQRDRWAFQKGIKHKMRTPLAGIITNMDLLERHAQKLQPGDLTDLAQRTHQSAERLREAIEDIITYADSTNPELARGQFPLAELPDLIIDIGAGIGLNPEPTVTDLNRKPEIDRTLPIAERSLELIVHELLENARKFHPTGQPTITTTIHTSASVIRIDITDDGIHLSPEQLAQVGTPYYQGEKYFTGEAQGMGLGLAMVTAILWNIGGAVQIQNRSDRPGVTVSLTFPTART